MFDSKELKKLEKKQKKWEEKFKNSRLQQRKFITVSMEEVAPLYTPLDSKDRDFDEKIGFPGEYPYTRGVQTSMYRGRTWTMRQFSGMGSARQTNERYHYLLKHGQTGLSVAFDMPTLMGYDSDHVFSKGEVGLCGVAVDSLKDMEIIFDGIPLDKISTSMTINSPSNILLAMYIAVAEKQGVPQEILTGTTQNDILKEYIAQKEWIYPPAPSMRLIVDSIEYCTKHVPKWNTISISGYHIREAGATAAQELAFTLADGFAYVEAAIERGMDVDDFAPRLSFFFNAQINLFEEAAKFRAARRMWCRIMRDRFGAREPRSWMLRFHTQTAGSSLTAQQPGVNVVRTTLEALAAVLGGTQSLHTNALDEALGLPTEESATLALRTQQVIAYESGVVDEPDPLGGSYYVERLTDEIERRAWEEIDRIEDMGGAEAAVESRYYQEAIARSAYRFQMEVESGKRTIVGVNRFVQESELESETLKIPATVEGEQTARLHKLKTRRDDDLVKHRLLRLEDAARDPEAPLMEFIIDAVEAYCTVGEVTDTLRRVWGEHRDRTG